MSEGQKTQHVGTRFEFRYTFDYEQRTVFDTKFRRELVAKCRRGGAPYFRLVDEQGTAHRVPVADLFGVGSEDDVALENDFEPLDFSDRYDFDFAQGAVVGIRGKGRAGGRPLTLFKGGGWEHYRLTRNDGGRVYVTPAEIRGAAKGREVWEVPIPPGARTFPQIFPNHAFQKDGTVWVVRQREPLLRPRLVPTEERPCGRGVSLVSAQGAKHFFTTESVKDMFKPKPHSA